MENNTKLTFVSQSSLLAKVNSSIGITNKLITENNKKLVAEIFESNPKFCVDLISGFYPLTSDILAFEKILNWDLISEYNELSNIVNELSPIEFNKIESFNWSLLSKNRNIMWSDHVINLLENNLRWDTLSWNTAIPWTSELIEKHMDKIEWFSLSRNEGILFDTEMIEKFSNKLKFKHLSENKSIQWSEYLLNKFEDKWDWDNLVVYGTFWNEKYIAKYYDKLGVKQWWYLARNEIPWSLDLIEKYADKFSWESLSANTKIAWNEYYIKLNEDRIFFRNLSYNTTMQWTCELLEQYENSWNSWSWVGLSCNKKLPWSEELISKYESKWEWFDFNHQFDLSSNENLPWSDNLIEKYSARWNWANLIKNKGIKWSVKLLHKYSGKLAYPRYKSPTAIWNALSPFIDDDMIINLLKKIENGEIES